MVGFWWEIFVLQTATFSLGERESWWLFLFLSAHQFHRIRAPSLWPYLTVVTSLRPYLQYSHTGVSGFNIWILGDTVQFTADAIPPLFNSQTFIPPSKFTTHLFCLWTIPGCHAFDGRKRLAFSSVGNAATENNGFPTVLMYKQVHRIVFITDLRWVLKNWFLKIDCLVLLFWIKEQSQ